MNNLNKKYKNGYGHITGTGKNVIFEGKIGSLVCVSLDNGNRLIGVIGKNGLKPDIKYTVKNGQFVKLV